MSPNPTTTEAVTNNDVVDIGNTTATSRETNNAYKFECIFTNHDSVGKNTNQKCTLNPQEGKKSSFFISEKYEIALPAYLYVDCVSSPPSQSSAAESKSEYLFGGIEIISNARNIECYTISSQDKETYLFTRRGIRLSALPSENSSSLDENDDDSVEWYRSVIVQPSGPTLTKRIKFKFLSLQNPKEQVFIKYVKITARFPQHVVASSNPRGASISHVNQAHSKPPQSTLSSLWNTNNGNISNNNNDMNSMMMKMMMMSSQMGGDPTKSSQSQQITAMLQQQKLHQASQQQRQMQVPSEILYSTPSSTGDHTKNNTVNDSDLKTFMNSMLFSLQKQHDDSLMKLHSQLKKDVEEIHKKLDVSMNTKLQTLRTDILQSVENSLQQQQQHRHNEKEEHDISEQATLLYRQQNSEIKETVHNVIYDEIHKKFIPTFTKTMQESISDSISQSMQDVLLPLMKQQQQQQQQQQHIPEENEQKDAQQDQEKHNRHITFATTAVEDSKNEQKDAQQDQEKHNRHITFANTAVEDSKNEENNTNTKNQILTSSSDPHNTYLNEEERQEIAKEQISPMMNILLNKPFVSLRHVDNDNNENPDESKRALVSSDGIESSSSQQKEKAFTGGDMFESKHASSRVLVQDDDRYQQECFEQSKSSSKRSLNTTSTFTTKEEQPTTDNLNSSTEIPSSFPSLPLTTSITMATKSSTNKNTRRNSLGNEDAGVSSRVVFDQTDHSYQGNFEDDGIKTVNTTEDEDEGENNQIVANMEPVIEQIPLASVSVVLDDAKKEEDEVIIPEKIEVLSKLEEDDDVEKEEESHNTPEIRVGHGQLRISAIGAVGVKTKASLFETKEEGIIEEQDDDDYHGSSRQSTIATPSVRSKAAMFEPSLSSLPSRPSPASSSKKIQASPISSSSKNSGGSGVRSRAAFFESIHGNKSGSSTTPSIATPEKSKMEKTLSPSSSSSKPSEEREENQEQKEIPIQQSNTSKEQARLLSTLSQLPSSKVTSNDDIDVIATKNNDENHDNIIDDDIIDSEIDTNYSSEENYKNQNLMMVALDTDHDVIDYIDDDDDDEINTNEDDQEEEHDDSHQQQNAYLYDKYDNENDEIAEYDTIDDEIDEEEKEKDALFQEIMGYNSTDSHEQEKETIECHKEAEDELTQEQHTALMADFFSSSSPPSNNSAQTESRDIKIDAVSSAHDLLDFSSLPVNNSNENEPEMSYSSADYNNNRELLELSQPVLLDDPEPESLVEYDPEDNHDDEPEIISPKNNNTNTQWRQQSHNELSIGESVNEPPVLEHEPELEPDLLLDDTSDYADVDVFGPSYNMDSDNNTGDVPAVEKNEDNVAKAPPPLTSTREDHSKRSVATAESSVGGFRDGKMPSDAFMSYHAFDPDVLTASATIFDDDKKKDKNEDDGDQIESYDKITPMVFTGKNNSKRSVSTADSSVGGLKDNKMPPDAFQSYSALNIYPPSENSINLDEESMKNDNTKEGNVDVNTDTHHMKTKIDETDLLYSPKTMKHVLTFGELENHGGNVDINLKDKETYEWTDFLVTQEKEGINNPIPTPKYPDHHHRRVYQYGSQRSNNSGDIGPTERMMYDGKFYYFNNHRSK